MKIDDLMQNVCQNRKDDFVNYVTKSEDANDYGMHLKNCSACQAAVDTAFKRNIEDLHELGRPLQPSQSHQAETVCHQVGEAVLIENWSLVAYLSDMVACLTDSDAPHYFHGNFYGHPNHPDGIEATSSKILGYREADQVFVCVSRCYRLGTIDPEGAKKYPGVSLEQLLKTLPRL